MTATSTATGTWYIHTHFLHLLLVVELCTYIYFHMQPYIYFCNAQPLISVLANSASKRSGPTARDGGEVLTSSDIPHTVLHVILVEIKFKETCATDGELVRVSSRDHKEKQVNLP